jgi:RNA-directed DNA polymerase
VKSDGAERESDGVVVPLIAGMNPAGGKGPDFGHAGRAGKREGMAGTAQPDYPQGRYVAPVKVRQLRICRSDALWAAWERVWGYPHQNRAYGLKGEWGSGLARAPRP